MTFLSGRKMAIVSAFCTAAFFMVSCSIPNLDTPECIEARPFIREFYSFHFGNEMTTTLKNIEARKRFLTPKLFETLTAAPTDADYFTTGTTEIPRAFKPGKCETGPNGSAIFEVLLFWKDESGSDQKMIRVETVKQQDKWLVEQVSR